MSLSEALAPILALDDLKALLIFGSDGLPIEMKGIGFQEDKLAAEAASVAKAAQTCFRALKLGDVLELSVRSKNYEIITFDLEGYYLAAVFRPLEMSRIEHLISETLPQIRAVLEVS